MNVIILFTYGVSLNDWYESGLLGRELKLYEEVARSNNIKYRLFTYGDSKDFEIKINKEFFEIVPIYTYINKSKFNLVNFLKSFLIGFLASKFEIEKEAVVKTNQLWGAWVGIILKIINKNKLIVRTGYDLLSFKKYQKKSKLKVFLYKLLTLLSLKFSNKYIVTSNNDLLFLEKNFPKYSKKILVIPNFVKVLKSKDIKDRSQKLVSVGRIENQKNYSYLLNELSNSKWEIDIVGEGSLKSLLLEEASKLKTNVNFVGKMNNDLVLEKLQNHQIYVSSTLFEGNPKSILEALSAGCIVIAPNVVGVNEIIKDQQNGFLYEPYPTELRNVLNKILNYDLETVSKNAVEFISKNFAIDVVTKKELETYFSL